MIQIIFVEKTVNVKNTEDATVKLDFQEISVKFKKNIGVLVWQMTKNVAVNLKEPVMK